MIALGKKGLGVAVGTEPTDLGIALRFDGTGVDEKGRVLPSLEGKMAGLFQKN
jgi:hypothetical protein